MPVYLITDKGEVWYTNDHNSIPASKSREEITEKKSEFGTTTQTRTIESTSGPVINSFISNKKIWTKDGKLNPGNGQESTLEKLR